MSGKRSRVSPQPHQKRRPTASHIFQVRIQLLLRTDIHKKDPVSHGLCSDSMPTYDTNLQYVTVSIFPACGWIIGELVIHQARASLSLTPPSKKNERKKETTETTSAIHMSWHGLRFTSSPRHHLSTEPFRPLHTPPTCPTLCYLTGSISPTYDWIIRGGS